jgi:DNA-binding MarR family transcriptional regulator
MSQATRTLKQLRKATALANRAMKKNGPKSYKMGVGALLKVLHKAGGEMSSRELVEKLSWDRTKLKEIVRKAERAGFVTIEDAGEKKTYAAKLTAEGDKLAEKRCAAQDKAAATLLEPLSADEIAQLDALTEKIILSAKEQGAHGKRKGGKKHRGWKKHCTKH